MLVDVAIPMSYTYRISYTYNLYICLIPIPISFILYLYPLSYTYILYPIPMLLYLTYTYILLLTYAFILLLTYTYILYLTYTYILIQIPMLLYLPSIRATKSVKLEDMCFSLEIFWHCEVCLCVCVETGRGKERVYNCIRLGVCVRMEGVCTYL